MKLNVTVNVPVTMVFNESNVMILTAYYLMYQPSLICMY